MRVALVAAMAFFYGSAGAQTPEDSGPSRSPLLSQRTLGDERICTYGHRPGSGPVSRLSQHRVGIGEPCPFFRPAERRNRPSGIPPFAVLRGEMREGNSRVCLYDFAGTVYRRATLVGAPCPLTPHFFD